MNLEKQVEKLPQSAVKMTLTIPQDDVQAGYSELVEKYARTAQIKGFRKGKVPRTVLERKFGPSLRAEALQDLVEKALGEALESAEERPLPYARPSLVEEDLELDLEKDLTFSVTYDVFPEVNPASPRGRTVEEPQVTVTDDDVAHELEEMRQRNAMVVEKEDGTVASGDMVTIIVTELDENETPLEDTRNENYQVVAGEEDYYSINGEIVGLAQGESKVVEKSYPEDHDDESLQGRTVKLGISVAQIKTRDVPDLDDEFAQDVNDDFETLDDLRRDIRERLERNAAERLRALKIRGLMDQVSQDTTLEIPASMVETELESSWRGMAEQYRMDPAQLEQILVMQGKSREEIFEEWRPAATERLKRSLIVRKLIESEEISVSDEDAEEQIRRDAADRGADAERVLEYYRSNNMLSYVQEELRERKLFDALLEASTITTGPNRDYLDLMQENE